MTDRDTVHTITAHRHSSGAVFHRCDCRAVVTCTHLLLHSLVTGGDMVNGERLQYHVDTDALEAKYGHLLKPEPETRRIQLSRDTFAAVDERSWQVEA